MTSPAVDVPIGVPVHGIGFGGALRRYVRGYVAFRGRASRSEYWWPQLVVGIWAIVVMLVATTVAGGVAAASVSGTPGSSAGLGTLVLTMLVSAGITVALMLPLALPNYSSGARRLRDAGFSGLLMLLCLVPFGSIAVFVMTLLPSKVEAGQWTHSQQPLYGNAPYGQPQPQHGGAPYGQQPYGQQPYGQQQPGPQQPTYGS